VEHGADQTRLEILEEFHRIARFLAQAANGLQMFVGLEQALIFAQRVFDFGVVGELRFLAGAEALGGFAFGHLEIANAAFAHQTRGFDGDAPAHLIGTTSGVHQKIPYASCWTFFSCSVCSVGPVARRAISSLLKYSRIECESSAVASAPVCGSMRAV